MVSPAHADYQMPAEVPLCQDDSITASVYGMPPMETRFFPIGWSKSNQFAYMSYYEDHDASGLISAQLRIFDIVIDTIQLGIGPPKEYDIMFTFDEIWEENQGFFSNLLSQSGIIQDSIILNDFPLVLGDDTLDFTIETEWVDAEESEMGWPYIKYLGIHLVSKKQGIKTVYEQSEQVSCIGAQICGYINNPYNKWIVLPMVLLHPGWEGPPCVTTIYVIGCDPTKGFSKNPY
jgi:hypothetical protein